MIKVLRKASLLATLGLALLANASCTKIMPQQLSFNYDQAAFIIDVPAYQGTGDVTLGSQQSDLNLDSAIRANTKELYQLKDVHLTGIDIISMTPGTNFNSLNYIHAYVSRPDLPEKVAAFIDNVPENSTAIHLNADESLDLTPYIQQEHTQYTLRGKLKSPQNQPMRLQIRATYHVTVEKDR
jgi:hypothetical protein